MSQLCVKVYGGLGNRIPALLSSQILAEDRNMELRICWKVHDICEYEKLFTNNIDQISEDEFDSLSKKFGHTYIKSDNSDVPQGSCVCVSAYCWYNREAPEFKRRFRQKFFDLTLQENIKDQLMVLPRNCIGIHARMNHPKINKSLSLFNGIGGDKPIFICSDSYDAFCGLKEIFPYAFHYDRRDFSRTKHFDSSMWAVLDFWTLIQAQVVYGFKGSTFCTFPRKIGKDVHLL